MREVSAADEKRVCQEVPRRCFGSRKIAGTRSLRERSVVISPCWASSPFQGPGLTNGPPQSPQKSLRGSSLACPVLPPPSANAHNLPAMASAKPRRAGTPASAPSSNASLTSTRGVVVCIGLSPPPASVSVRCPRAPASQSEGCAGCRQAISHLVRPMHIATWSVAPREPPQSTVCGTG